MNLIHNSISLHIFWLTSSRFDNSGLSSQIMLVTSADLLSINLAINHCDIVQLLFAYHVKATGGVKNMLVFFERCHRCGVDALYGMSKFYSVQKLSGFQCVGPLTFL